MKSERKYKSLDELKIRKWVRKTLAEDSKRLYGNPESQLFEYSDNSAAGAAVISAFVSPFKNLLNVAKVATKDLLSIAKLNWDVMFTLRPSKQKEAMAKYAERKKNISAEWKQAMAPIDKTLASADAKILGFMLNPAGFLGMELAKGTWNTAAEAKKHLEDTGWLKNKDDLWRAGGKDKEKPGAVDVLGTGKKLLGDLSKIFFFSHHERPGSVLSEEKEDKNVEAGSQDAAAGVQGYLDQNPLATDAIKKSAEAMLDSKQQQIDEIMGIFNVQIKLLQGLSNAKDLKSFLGVIDSAGNEGFDLGQTGLDKAKENIEADVKKILSKPDAREGFVKAYLKEKGEKIPEKGSKEKLPEVADEELRPTIERVVFMSSKQGIQEKLVKGIGNLRKQAEDSILEGEPTEEDWPLMSQTELGKQYVTMLQDALKKIRSA